MENSTKYYNNNTLSNLLQYQLILLLFSFFNTALMAQSRLSTPMEIMSFMEASPTKYEIQQLYGPDPKRPRPVLANGTFIEIHEEREYAIEYEHLESCKEEKWRIKALEYINVENPNYKKARKLFHKILNLSPNNAQIKTYLGQTYREQGDFTKARYWLSASLEDNPIDYTAHQTLAELFLEEGIVDSARHHITIAHLYNRNNPLVLKRMAEIYAEDSLTYYSNWGFDPKFYLEQEDSTIVIIADGIWLTYAMYKAVWEYEPDYHYIKAQQEVSDYLFHAEMEATVGTYLTYSAMRSEDQRNFPSLGAFELALDQQMVEEYVMYEVLLVDHPTLGAHLTNDFKQRLINYIVRVRTHNFVQH